MSKPQPELGRFKEMAKRPGANKENYNETQSVFLALGRIEFATYGFAKASTNRIVEQSGMARGSLYYHFKDKEDFFRSIWTHMTIESNAEIERQLTSITDPFKALHKGADIFLQHALDPVFRRIVLIEGLVAIPYLERMSITANHYAKTIGVNIARAIEQGILPKNMPLRAANLLIYSVLAEYGRALEYEADPENSKHRLLAMFAWTLEKLRTPTPLDAMFGQ